ncbi:hypothetical protein SAMN04488494_0598 [Xylanibacter ruminicola]|uniref:Uncharacterized protein n=1 Tax=Xylanibacter ruminicola TaxID=839 RepID=A0A1M7D1N0_XYLRU|nr:hypothetical protein [Xylanibacter ruminicola]SHL73380.1 hypothetical protein SAMN04488494_0598 [Xylanibacter ruminicola]
MATNYDEHPYARTLRFFEAYYPYDTEDVNYAELMLSMDKLSTIDELFTVRNRIIDKHFTSGIYLLKMPKDVCEPLAIGSRDRFGQSYRSMSTLHNNIKKDVCEYYNANVIRLFKDSKEVSYSICGEFIVNLSKESAKYEEQINEIVQCAKVVHNIDVDSLSKELYSRKKSLHEKRLRFDKFEKGMNGYVSAKQDVQEDLDFLIGFKWRMTSFEKERYSIFLPQEMRNNPNNQKKKNYTTIWIYVIIGIIILVLMILLAPIIDVLFPWLVVFGFMFWVLGKF